MRPAATIIHPPWDDTMTRQAEGMTMPHDDFAAWREAIAGGKPGMHEGEPWCGYFKMRDRRGLNIQKAPVKRPWIACAIWRGSDGELHAELAKTPVPVDRIWPYCAKHPIPYETYAYWHQHDRWPDEEKAA